MLASRPMSWFAFLLLTAALTWADTATVKQITGKANWRGGEVKEWQALKVDMTLEARSWIATGEDSSVVLQFGDHAAVTVRELSVIYLRTLEEKRKDLDVERGAIWNKVKPGKGDYRISTPAAVAAVRGTSFFVIAMLKDGQPEKSVIGVWEGELGVFASAQANQPDAATAVKQGQVVEVLFNQRPKLPMAMLQAQLREQQMFDEQMEGLGLAAVLGGGQMLQQHQELVQEAEDIIKRDNAQRRGADKVRQTDFPTLLRAMARLHHDTGFLPGKGRRFVDGKATLMPLLENRDYAGNPIPKWNGPYLESDLRDPFGGEYLIYEEPGSRGRIIWLQSNGLDREPRSPDDIRTRINERTLQNEYEKLQEQK